MSPDEDALEHLEPLPGVRSDARERVRDGRPARRPLVQPERDLRARARGAASSRSARSGRGSGRPRRGGCPRTAPGAAPCGSRTRPTTPTRTSTPNTSTRSANQPWWPSHGSVQSRSTAPRSAITIVGKRTRKPQKMNACIEPRARAAGAASAGRARSPPRCRRARATSPARPAGLARAGRAGRAAARGGAKSPLAIDTTATRASRRRERAHRGSRRGRRSSAEIAGRTSCRSPITA